MTLFEILDEMGNLSNTHELQFEVNNFGVIIRKYFYYGGKPYKFSLMFDFVVFKYKDLEDCVLEFERRLQIEMNKGGEQND